VIVKLLKRDPAPSLAPPAEIFPLRPGARLALPLSLLGALPLWLATPISVAYGTLLPVLCALAASILAGTVLFWRRGRGPRAVFCGCGELTVPGFWGTARIRLEKVHALYRLGQTLYVAQSGRAQTLALARRQLVDPEGLERLEALLLLHLEAAGIDLAALARRRAVAATSRSVPYLTGALALGLIGVFAFEVATDAMSSMRGLIERGAVAPVLVARGEWWRVLSGTLLHASASHLVLNLLGLLSFGVALERRFGRWRVAAICLVSWITGGALALLSQAVTIVGASGIVFGLAGAWLGQLRSMRELPQSRLALILIGGLLVFNLASGIWTPQVSFLGHLGGLLGGLALALWYAPRIDMADAARSQNRWLRAGVGASAALLLACAGYGLSHGGSLDFAAELRREVAQGYDERDPEDIGRALRWAAPLVTDREARAEDLQQARSLLERSADRVQAPIYLDTLAALRFRTGDPESALQAQLDAVSQRVRRLSLRALLNGEADAFLARLGVYFAAVSGGSRARSPLDAVVLGRTEDGRALDLELTTSEPRGRVLYLLAYQGDEQTPVGIVGARVRNVSGLLRLGLPPAVARARLELVYTGPARVRPPRNESRAVSLQTAAVRFLEGPP
jgi:membrane associated rhomboid family serine protease